MSEHDARFERWDGAYVLGALGADDRRDYEEHLRGCERCRADVAELTGMPGLLSRVPSDRALGLIDDASVPARDPASTELNPPADLSARLQQRARQRRRRPLLVATGAGIAAAVLIVAGVLGIRLLNTPSPTLTADLQPAGLTAGGGSGGTGTEQLSASVRLYAKAWGTEVDTQCRHQVPTGPSPAGEGDERYGLFVIDTHGQETLVSSWRGIPKSPIETTAATDFRIEQMSRLELRSLPGGQVLLTGPVRR